MDGNLHWAEDGSTHAPVRQCTLYPEVDGTARVCDAKPSKEQAAAAFAKTRFDKTNSRLKGQAFLRLFNRHAPAFHELCRY